MFINYIIWSSLISLIAVVFLYPLRHHARGPQVSRFYSLLFLFPALISVFYILKFTILDGVVINKLSPIPLTPFFFGVRITGLNACIVATTIITMSFLAFLSSAKKFVEQIAISSFSLAAIFLISSAPDQFVGMTEFVVGALVINYFLLNDESEKTNVKQITNDFLLHIASSFLAFLAILSILSEQGNLLLSSPHIVSNKLQIWPRGMYFMAIAIRVITLASIDNTPQQNAFSTLKNTIIRKVFVGLGSQILLLQFSAAIFRNDFIDTFFLGSAIALFLYALTFLVLDFKLGKSIEHSFSCLTAAAFVAISAKYSVIAIGILCAMLVIFGIALLLISRPGFIIRRQKESAARSSWAAFLDRVLLRFPIQLTYFLIKLFTNILNPIYAGFFIYRLPQLVIAILQTPLRFLHNGNIQRSLIFILILLMTYAYWWGQ